MAQHILIVDKEVAAQIPGLTLLCVMKCNRLYRKHTHTHTHVNRNMTVRKVKIQLWSSTILQFQECAYLYTSQDYVLC